MPKPRCRWVCNEVFCVDVEPLYKYINFINTKISNIQTGQWHVAFVPAVTVLRVTGLHAAVVVFQGIYFLNKDKGTKMLGGGGRWGGLILELLTLCCFSERMLQRRGKQSNHTLSARAVSM